MRLAAPLPSSRPALALPPGKEAVISTFANRSLAPVTVVQLIAGMALFGSATPMSKIIGDAFPVFTASFARMVIASAVLAPIVWLTTARFTEMRRSDLWVMMGIAAAGMVGFTATMLFGMRLTTGVIGATIMSSTPRSRRWPPFCSSARP